MMYFVLPTNLALVFCTVFDADNSFNEGFQQLGRLLLAVSLFSTWLYFVSKELTAF